MTERKQVITADDMAKLRFLVGKGYGHLAEEALAIPDGPLAASARLTLDQYAMVAARFCKKGDLGHE
jgi:hypothetical protein